jgi:hypothetical protein
MKDKLKNQIDNIIGNEIETNVVCEDMTPTMRQIYDWGLRNITIDAMKKIIKEMEGK